jgi:hypothetical protein
MDARLRELERAFDNDPSLERMKELQRMYRLHGRFLECMTLCQALLGVHECPSDKAICQHHENALAATHDLGMDENLSRILPIPDQLQGVRAHVCSRCGGVRRVHHPDLADQAGYEQFYRNIFRNSRRRS